MDIMQEWEMIEFTDVVEYAGYSSWEQTRLLISCWVNSKKVKKLSDILKFPWDSDKNNDIEISNEDINRLKKLSQNYIKNTLAKENASTIID